MSLKVKLEGGVFVPLEPVPNGWQNGEEFEVERNGAQDEALVLASDDEYWKELDRLASEIDLEDWNRMQAALDQHRREAKDWMRRRMGLA